MIIINTKNILKSCRIMWFCTDLCPWQFSAAVIKADRDCRKEGIIETSSLLLSQIRVNLTVFINGWPLFIVILNNYFLLRDMKLAKNWLEVFSTSVFQGSFLILWSWKGGQAPWVLLWAAEVYSPFSWLFSWVCLVCSDTFILNKDRMNLWRTGIMPYIVCLWLTISGAPIRDVGLPNLDQIVNFFAIQLFQGSVQEGTKFFTPHISRHQRCSRFSLVCALSGGCYRLA